MPIYEEDESKESRQEQAEEILRMYARLSGKRGNWESHWLEIAERVIPNHRTQFESLGKGSLATKGDRRTEYIFDSTASIALTRFASILDSLLTPRNQTWHRIMTSNPELNKDRTVRLYFEEVNRALFKYRYAPVANFSSQNQQNYKSLGAYGTGCVFVDPLQNAIGIRYRNVHLSEIYFCENHQGIVDTALRYFPLTIRQAKQKWGDKLPDTLLEKGKHKPDDEYFFIHCVKPRENYDPGRADFRGMKYASYYVSEEGRAFLEEGGYETFPYAISRYEQADGEVYGRSPAMEVLPAIKTLNEEKKTLLKQGHRSVDPVILTHDDGVLDAFSLKPGSIISGAVSEQGRSLVQTLPVGNVAVGKDLMDDERRLINDVFLVNLFQILVESPQMSATEVMERSREKGILLAPTIGRQQSEYLGPLIDREIDLLARQGLLPPQPAILKEAEGEYRTEYDSPLSRTQRAEEASGIMRTVETALSVVNITQDPSPLDHFDWDTIIPAVAEIQAVPAKWIRGAKEVAAIRAARQQQQEVQTAIQAGPSVASVVKATQ